MVLRYAQAYQDGEVRLGSFSRAELDSVALDPEALPAALRGPALLAAAPLLAGLAADRLGPANDLAWAEASLLETADDAGLDDTELAAAAAGLERRGFVRPGAAQRSDANVPDEYAGWSADPAGGSAPRQVAITGDLGVITRMRSQPYWVAEAAASSAPSGWDADAAWQRTGRMYAAYRPPSALVEVPVSGGAPHFALLWQNRSVLALVTWCGIDLDELADKEHKARADPVPPAPTAAVSPEFTSLTRLRIAHPDGQQVVVRTLITAAGSGRRHWMLTGERAQTATRVSVDQIGEQIDVLLQPVDPTGP
jgi:hypothetical protein